LNGKLKNNVFFIEPVESEVSNYCQKPWIAIKNGLTKKILTFSEFFFFIGLSIELVSIISLHLLLDLLIYELLLYLIILLLFFRIFIVLRHYISYIHHWLFLIFFFTLHTFFFQINIELNLILNVKILNLINLGF